MDAMELMSSSHAALRHPQSMESLATVIPAKAGIPLDRRFRGGDYDNFSRQTYYRDTKVLYRRPPAAGFPAPRERRYRESCRSASVQKLSGQTFALGGAFIAHFAMCATLETRIHGRRRPAPPKRYVYLFRGRYTM